MGEASSEKISLKLLIDRKANRVICGEAGKDFVDFLFQFLSLPVGTVVKLLSKDKMVGSLGKIYESIEEMPAKYMQPNVNKELLLKASDTSEVFDQCDDDSDTEYAGDNYEYENDTEYDGDNSEFLYRCRYGCAYVSKNMQVKCTACGQSSMNVQMEYIESPENDEAADLGKGGGYVKELVNYMIMDNLVVKPISTISSFTLLSNVKDMSAVESLEVYIGKNEVLLYFIIS